MNPTTHNPIGPGSAPETFPETFQETLPDTLHLIAGLPAPEGLEGRVHEALRRAPHARRILSWPAVLRPESGWMRAAAAAAFVFVVAGGGWGVYSYVERGQPAKTIVLPRVPVSGGFSSAGAMRTPRTLNGPVVAHPAPGRPSQAVAPERLSRAEAPERAVMPKKTKIQKAMAQKVPATAQKALATAQEAPATAPTAHRTSKSVAQPTVIPAR